MISAHQGYYNKHVPTEDRACPCGDPLQSRDHIITACPTYENQRQVSRTPQRPRHIRHPWHQRRHRGVGTCGV
ncbi:hypothetical protein SCLCIDRAFT_1218404 [Scleroderma citrinum Foug A]|uniref:Uncharacterized protein n=1 Tax=Scleroderma citrinum Foug A TaxID=1036808 RepID=A0A0C2ZA17_9AGAM|nr:hypothetical protein SCLCIDRAFT_1218404 [Scleroderma citrinum Foug A]